MAIVLGFSQQGAIRAGGEPPRPLVAPRLLPTNVGVGISTDQTVTIQFDEAMDRASVASTLLISPAQPITLGWSPDGRSVRVRPQTRWQTDARYVVEIPAASRTGRGGALGTPKRISFTTRTAPTVADFQLRFAPALTAAPLLDAAADAAVAGTVATTGVPPADTAAEVSARTSISVAFSVPMDELTTTASFMVSPAVPGTVTWTGGTRMTFTPAAPLTPDTRYAVSIANARDAEGNPLGGDTSFSFTTRDGAQIVATRPKGGATKVTGSTVNLRFSQPMNPEATARAFRVTEARTGGRIGGTVSWNATHTHLTFTADDPFAIGHTYRVSLLSSARDADGNQVARTFTFSTPAPVVVVRPKAAPAPSAPRRPSIPPASGSGVTYALNQINASRAAYGFAPLVLDGAVSAVANAHAWDMVQYGYFSHTGRDGSTVRTRLARAGIAFTHSGENICEYTGIGVNGTLKWCHGAFMAEPYPGYANHIGNILDPDFRRVGIGIATSGGKVVVVWDFAG